MKASLFWLIIITFIWIVSFENKEKHRMVEVVGIQEFPSVKLDKEKIALSAELIKLAKQNLGKPYLFGKTGPNAFDCSGFIYGMYKQLGIRFPRTSLAQSQIKGNKIKREFLKKGDLVFFDTAKEGKVNHTGLYLGDGKFIHASSGKANSVTISSLDAWYKDKFKWGKQFNAD